MTEPTREPLESPEDENLDKVKITPKDIQRAQKQWKEDAPDARRNLLDAEGDEADERT